MPRWSAKACKCFLVFLLVFFKLRQSILEKKSSFSKVPSAHLILRFSFSRLTHWRRGGAERGGRGQKVGQKDEGLFIESVTQNHEVHLLPMIQTLDQS